MSEREITVAVRDARGAAVEAQSYFVIVCTNRTEGRDSVTIETQHMHPRTLAMSVLSALQKALGCSCEDAVRYIQHIALHAKSEEVQDA